MSASNLEWIVVLDKSVSCQLGFIMKMGMGRMGVGFSEEGREWKLSLLL